MEWKVEWNKNSVWNTKDARMEWNGRFQERNGRQSSILPYQFHTRFRAFYLQKNIYGCRVMMLIVCRQIAVLWLFVLRKQCTYCITASTLQLAALML